MADKTQFPQQLLNNVAMVRNELRKHKKLTMLSNMIYQKYQYSVTAPCLWSIANGRNKTSNYVLMAILIDYFNIDTKGEENECEEAHLRND